MSDFHGIQIYEILNNGSLLNAIYTNTGLSNSGVYAIDNEIARKKPDDETEGLEGVYDCRFIETGERFVTSCDLEIRKRNEVYEFTWRKKSTILFSGIGLMAGTTHIGVSYTNV